MGNASYESYDRGTAKNAWVFGSDGKTPLLGEVGLMLRNWSRLSHLDGGRLFQGKSPLQGGKDRWIWCFFLFLFHSIHIRV